MVLNPYVVGIVVLKSGERLPILRFRASGIPLHEPTLYALTVLRARNRSTSTIEHALRSIMVLRLVFDRLKVDLSCRLDEGRLLELGEVDELIRWCHEPMEALIEDVAAEHEVLPPKVVSLGKRRTRALSVASAGVSRTTASNRILYIRGYLNWLATSRLLKMKPGSTQAALTTATELVCRALDERAKPSKRRSTVKQRMGLAPVHLQRLMEVIEPTSPDNPWVGGHVRERNALLVKWLLNLGIRRGEALVVRTSDINFQMNEVLIPRRADDPDDPRRYEPRTKTNDRLLALSDDLAVLTRRYITGARRSIKGARKHEYLFVANGSGAPLSLSSLDKIFVQLRRKCPDLPRELFAHILRYCWNDAFTAVADNKHISEEDEKRMRSRLMGWSATSDSAVTYTRRHVQKKAGEAMLALQEKMIGRGQDRE